MNINKLFENKKFNIDKIWKKINKEKSLIYEHSYIILNDNIAKIYVNDQNILLALDLNKNEMLKKIKEEIPNIENLEIVFTREQIKKEKETNDRIDSNNIDFLKRKKIVEDIKKKYENIKDESERNMYIAYDARNKLIEYDLKKNKAKICIKCKEYFIPIGKEIECVICRNKDYVKKINRLKYKILTEYISKEYAINVLKLDEKIYNIALNSILDEIMLDIYEKIKIQVNEKNDVIDLDKEIRKYSKYYNGNIDKEINDIYINNFKNRIKNNILKIYNRDMEIK